MTLDTLTADWLATYRDTVRRNEDFASSAFWRLHLYMLPQGVDATHPEVIAALEHIRSVVSTADEANEQAGEEG